MRTCRVCLFLCAPRTLLSPVDPPQSTIYTDFEPPVRRWYHYVPITMTVCLMLAPHPSLLYVLVRYHLQTREDPLAFGAHLFTTYALTFMAFSSLIICVSRDPGPVSLQDADSISPTARRRREDDEDDAEEIELTEALVSIDYNAPGRWCNKCWVRGGWGMACVLLTYIPGAQARADASLLRVQSLRLEDGCVRPSSRAYFPSLRTQTIIALGLRPDASYVLPCCRTCAL